MSERNSISSTVDVAVDPTTAFRVFTEEMYCWWLQGPINFHDSSRAFEQRLEPGVGGRIVEVYDCETGDGLELAIITVWEPGSRLEWASSIDDVATVVAFEPIARGTRVTVTATIAAGGEDRGGTAWVRTTPTWFGRWIERREREAHEPRSMSRLAVAVHYARPAAAARWLRDVFGFTPASAIPADQGDDPTWIEFHVGAASLIVLAGGVDSPPSVATHVPWVFVDDLEAQFKKVHDAGADIVAEIKTYGAKTFEAKDLEGLRWTFAQAGPRM